MKIRSGKIRNLMAEKLMTQKDIAAAASVSRATVNVTLQRGSCSIVTVGKIAKALGVDPAEIVEMEENGWM